MNNNPNILLVHGAWADGSCWSKVLLHLKAQGFNATAAQISLNSLEDDIAVVQRLLSAYKEPTVLVGHSYGGAVITGAAYGQSQVKALVYITAFGLDEGESLASLSKQGSPSAGSAAIEADDHDYLWINREKFHHSFSADITDDEAYIMSAVQKPLHGAAFGGVERVAAWKTIPSWYLVCTNDLMIPPPAQEFMAKRMNATIQSIASSHSPFMSKPEAVVDIIAQATKSVAKSAELVAR
jgi:pimeloyl-ACP methyl ester carboxylesterase